MSSEVQKKSRSEKSKPLEFSCRAPVPVPKPQRQGLIKRQSDEPTDPRFNRNIVGDYDATRFAKNYEFLNEYREVEKKDLMSKLKSKRISESEKSSIEKELTRMQSQDVARKRATMESEIRQELKKKELDAVAKTGKKVYYHPRSEIKRIMQERTESDLKSKGQLERFKAKKEKRKASEEKRHSSMPKTRRIVEFS